MTDIELIRSFDPSARFFTSRVDDTTLCVEFKAPYPGAKTTAVASDYAKRIRHFQKHGW